MAVRVVVAEDSFLVREGLRQLLESSPTVEVVASCADLDTLFEAIEREVPDLVLTDIRMPPTRTDEGIQVASRLRETHPDTGVIILSQYSEPAYVLELLEQGSDGRGYLLKERVRDRGQLVSAIDAVARGGSLIDPKIVEVLVAARSRSEHSPLLQLTSRELEVLAEIAAGKSNNAIADSLVLTKRAVEKHINSIFMKLGLATAEDVSKRVKATLLYLAQRRLLQQVLQLSRRRIGSQSWVASSPSSPVSFPGSRWWWSGSPPTTSTGRSTASSSRCSACSSCP